MHGYLAFKVFLGRCEVLMEVIMKCTVFWDVMLYSLIESYQHFEELLHCIPSFLV
jgi:hypothetical protein